MVQSPCKIRHMMTRLETMKLRPWLQLNGMSAAAFAEAIGRTETAVNRWMAGTRRPQYEDMRAIYERTDGAVEPNDWVLKDPG